MTLVYGQIESLRKIKENLDLNGINRFQSVGEITRFKENYSNARQVISDRIENDHKQQIDKLRTEKNHLENDIQELDSRLQEEFNNETKTLKKKQSEFETQDADNSLLKFWKNIQFLWIDHKLNRYKKSFHVTRKRVLSRLEERLYTVKRQFVDYSENDKQIIAERCSSEFDKLERTKNVIDQLDPLIAGAIGENLVEKELRKLGDENTLFNDFYTEFDPPIYNRKEADRIFSIQIDHLLVTPAGLFIIETKNWSAESVHRLDLRSPVEQVRRTNFAMFVMLNGNSLSRIDLRSHHWGDKQIPIKNLIVMINNKPKEQFKYVSVKNLKELIGYISYFEPVFDAQEVKMICNYLKRVGQYTLSH